MRPVEGSLAVLLAQENYGKKQPVPKTGKIRLGGKHGTGSRTDKTK